MLELLAKVLGAMEGTSSFSAAIRVGKITVDLLFSFIMFRVA